MHDLRITDAAPIFQDHLHGPDVIYTLMMGPCPGCGAQHTVTLHRITGRFMFRCGHLELSGMVDDWPQTRHAWEAQQQLRQLLGTS